MIDALAAEWLKLRSARSTLISLGVVALGVAGMSLLAFYAAGAWDRMPAAARAHAAVSPLEPITALIAQLALAALGALAISAEYSTGMIRVSLAAMPRRRAFLAAKACTVGTVALLAGLAGIAATSLGSRAIIGDRPIPVYSTPGVHAPGQILALSLSVMVAALASLGLATVFRSAVGALAGVVALLWVLPIVALHLPAPWSHRVSSFLLTSLPNEVAGTPSAGQGYGTLLPGWAALLVMAGYAALPLAGAAAVLRRRDA